MNKTVNKIIVRTETELEVELLVHS